MTVRYLITDPHGQPCGTYLGATPAEAFAAMSQAADGESLARDVSGIDPEAAGWTATLEDDPCEDEPITCARCGAHVEIARECYVIPICYACLPPPAPLPIAWPSVAAVIACPWPTHRGIATLDAAVHALAAHARRHTYVGDEYAIAASMTPEGCRGGYLYAAWLNHAEAIEHRAEIAALTGAA